MLTDEIFVFGSNLKGIHGAGAALVAKRKYGAVYGVGVGRTGMAYAIPSKSTPYQTMPIAEIQPHVMNFMDYAQAHPLLRFFVTRIGCGLAGYTDDQIAPLFVTSPKNVIFPVEWKPFLGEFYEYHDRSGDPKKFK